MSLALAIKKKREERAVLVTEAQSILKKSDEDKKPMTAEQEKRFDELHEQSDKLQEEIKGLEKEQQRRSWLDEEDNRRHEPEQRRSDPNNPGGQPGGDPGGEPGRHRNSDPRELRWKLQASGQARSVTIQGPRATSEYRDAFDKFIRHGNAGLNADEHRALSAGVSTEGGFLTTPMEMAADLIKAVDDLVVIRQLATVDILSSAESLGVVSLDADPADADWTSELETGDEDSSMSFGKRQLTPRPFAKLVKVSNTLLRRTSGSAESLLRERLAYKFAITEEKAFLTGSGVNQPLGLFTASDDGIPTSRDVSEDSTTTAFTADSFINVKYALKAQYQNAATTRWLLHRDAVKRARKLKDSEGVYIWRPGLQRDQGDTILDVPIVQSEYVPNTFTTGSYVGLIGDMRFYRIADALSMTLQRLVELYARTNQTGFIGRKETDGQPVLAEAFSRMKLA